MLSSFLYEKSSGSYKGVCFFIVFLVFLAIAALLATNRIAKAFSCNAGKPV
jgi:hypothetical protein